MDNVNEKIDEVNAVTVNESVVLNLKLRDIVALKQILNNASELDLLNTIHDLSNENQVLIYRLLSKDKALSLFEHLDTADQEKLIHSFTDEAAIEIITGLEPDDRVRLLDELPAAVVKRMLAALSPSEREVTNLLMGYEEKTAGRIMTPEYVRLLKIMTVAEAIDRIKKTAKDKETIYTLYITDDSRRLDGVLSLRDLLFADPNDKIEDIMVTNPAKVSTDDDQEEAARLLQKLGLLSVPVVDKENRLVGIITVDDVIDIIKEETTEDFAKMAAITPVNKPYNSMSIMDIVKARSPWLLILMISATFTHMIIESFEGALEIYPVLYAAIPMLMDTAGNAGAQSSTTIVRAMSLHEVRLRNLFSIIWKEIRVSVICGVILAIVNFGRMYLLSGTSPEVAVVVSITLVLTVFVAKTIGSALPMLAERVKLDPAVMSSTVVTTIADVLALIVYFHIARVLLGI
ncbi:MAG: magnesium transporter [Oscillospiraceae bacterium]|jgi:magnesium transporter|nr:magnesium transporter [Oscillospiraceae bacterium]